ncbi:hypothetical protein CPLU01_04328 [Colletotrichum plurivorum]|uniref:Uncharacterized protein n=1 Tax=Colletotrichum plurivorum TaxID=2175906 RepID=A0A8H6NJ24_9PEZI|nr:hypothetical protein CPLU01_04328 [Colletotrichum plurivorum]
MHRIVLDTNAIGLAMISKLDQLAIFVQAGLVGTAVDRSRRCDAPRAASTTEVAAFQTLLQSYNADTRHVNKVGTTPEGSDQRCESSSDAGEVEPELIGDELGRVSELWTFEKMQESLKHLETFHESARLAYLTSVGEQASVSAEMRADLVRMVSSKRSAALWIEGPADVESPSNATLLAAHLVRDLKQLSIPTIFHFVYRPKDASLDRERALLEMIYSLVYQISRVLPEHAYFEAGLVEKVKSLPAVPQNRFEVTSILAPAVNLLDSLLGALPPLLFCVVDGFELLVRDSNSPELKAATKQFVACICEAAASQLTAQPQIFKSLWTTDGFCRNLQQARNSRVLAYVEFEDDEDHESMTLRGREMSPLVEG